MLSTLSRQPKHKSVASERIVVTPEIASAWLDKNTHNRRRSSSHVSRLARDMKNGHWSWTGDPIRFSHDGVLLDGQHRLAACIEAGVPFETTVIYNLPPSIQPRIDTGKPRSAADSLTLMGQQASIALTSALRALLSERDGTYRANQTCSISEILDAAERHPKMSYSVRRVREKKMPNGIVVSTASMIHYIGRNILNLEDRAEAFVHVLQNGIPDYDGDPVHLLRERMLLLTGETRIARNVVDNGLKQAWNAFAIRKPVHRMQWPKALVKIDGIDPERL